MNLFDLGKEQFKITKPVRLIELFAGIGSQAKALENLGVDFEPWVICEFDKYAIKSYNAIHGTDFETSDICELHGKDLKITDKDKYCYIMTYSFPCQDLSLAGKRKGMSRDSGTRSGLLWEVERLLKECDELPDVLLMENVTEVHCTNNKDDFREWVSFLESIGYSCYVQDLNAKDYGIPQSRNRTFMISLLEGYYEFPEKMPLELRLQDMLEDGVDEKYYLKGETIDKFLCEIKEKLDTHTHTQAVYLSTTTPDLVNNDIACCINTAQRGLVNHSAQETGIVEIGNYTPSGFKQSRILGRGGITPTITENHGTVYAVMDYRYDEGFRVREDGEVSPTIPNTHTGTESLSGQPFVVCE